MVRALHCAKHTCPGADRCHCWNRLDGSRRLLHRGGRSLSVREPISQICLLFLGLVFLSYFVFEVTTGRRVHPAQYVLVGLAQIIFYLLLLSLSERIGFDLGFLIAGAATVTLLSLNAQWVFSSRKQGVRALAIFTSLYALNYLLMRLEDNALLVGAIASFLAVSVAMYFTREIDWYSSLPGSGIPEQGVAPLAMDEKT